jgi:hypothetical protein
MDNPVRRLIKPTTPRTVHLLNLRGVLPHSVQAEATTESAFVQAAALCPATRSIASQPETIQLPGQTYTPDYRVDTVDGSASIWEVKLEARIPKHRAMFDLVARQLAERSVHFFVVSEQSLRRRRQHQEVRLVLRYAKGHFLATDVEKVLEHLLARPDGASIEELVIQLGVTKEVVFHLMAKRAITFSDAISTAPRTRVIHTDFLEQHDALQLARWFGVSPWRTHA